MQWDELRVVVLVDEDRQNCQTLKLELEDAARQAQLETKTSSRGGSFQVLNRIAVEELEAWFFGDAEAISAAYPGVSPSLSKRSRFRDPDNIGGGTWEALEKVLQNAGYHRGGLAKIKAAREIARHMEPERNTSHSFHVFRDGLVALVST